MRKDMNWLIIFIGMAVLLGTIFITCDVMTAMWEQEAIKEGHAEYYLDKEYRRQWRWLPVKKIEKK